jgi:hypothetical protein
MRPPSEVRHAVLKAVVMLATPERGPTLQEIDAAVQGELPVGSDTVRRYLDNIKRSGAVCIARQRRVDYRNRPVAEYAPAGLVSVHQGWVDLGNCLGAWAR